ncbi:MAG: TerB family tellurite resistance protein [Vulcanimicrobiota bacterium]
MQPEIRRELVRTLFEVAMADGSFDPEEQEAIADILANLGFPEDFEMPEPGVPRNTPRLSELLPSQTDRIAAMRSVLRVAHADGVLAAGELRYIDKLADEMEIPLEQLVELHREVLEEI